MKGKGIHSSVGSAVSLPLSLLLLIFFFLPWVDLTRGSEKQGSASGWQLTVGQMTMEIEQEEKPKARPWFIVCLILPVVLLVVGAMAVTGRLPSAGAGKVLLVLGVVGLIMMIVAANVNYSDAIKDYVQGGGRTESMETGTTGILWVSLVLYILVGACGAANLFLPRLAAAPTAAAPTAAAPSPPAEPPPPAQPPPAQPPAEPPAQT